MFQFVSVILIVTLCFIVWAEYSVGDIAFRPNSMNQRTFNLSSLLGFLVNPLKARTLWTFGTLDINYPFIIGYTLVIYYFV
jgi:hypothetical protein